MGGAKEAGHSCPASKAIPIQRSFAKMMGFAKGSTPSYGLMRRMEVSGHCQIIMATHSPVLMAYPDARLLRLTKYGPEPVTVQQTDHYKVMREFCEDPAGFVEAAIEE
jgi:hypothetical protein